MSCWSPIRKLHPKSNADEFKSNRRLRLEVIEASGLRVPAGEGELEVRGPKRLLEGWLAAEAERSSGLRATLKAELADHAVEVGG